MGFQAPLTSHAAATPTPRRYLAAGVALPYTSTAYGLEFAAFAGWSLLEPSRLALARRGNRAGAPGALLVSAALGVVSLLYLVFQLAIQSYVLRMDLIASGAGVVFTLPQVVLAALVATGVA